MRACLLQIEGVAYRGRVMVEVDMSLGKLPTDKHEEIKIADQKRIAVSRELSEDTFRLSSFLLS